MCSGSTRLACFRLPPQGCFFPASPPPVAISVHFPTHLALAGVAFWASLASLASSPHQPFAPRGFEQSLRQIPMLPAPLEPPAGLCPRASPVWYQNPDYLHLKMSILLETL